MSGLDRRKPTKKRRRGEPALPVRRGGGVRRQMTAATRTPPDDEFERRTRQLSERIKELRCLYGISRLRERSDIGLDDFLGQMIELIPPAWQFPDVACARIQLRDREYTSANYRPSAVRQTSPIAIAGRVVGQVEVCYRERLPAMGIQPFLDEERSLIDSIAERIASSVARYDAGERIVEYQQQLRSLASELALTSERERRRIAQELHNQIGHSLATIKFKLGALRSSVADGGLEEALGLLERAIQVSRDLTFELSPPVLHELGLGAALEWLVHQLRANYGIAGEYQDDRKSKPLREDLRIELFQAMRELLANVGKHSRASMAQVRATVVGDELQLELRDDGVGFDPALRCTPRTSADGWGLFGIRERLAHLGASMVIRSAPGQGTQVLLTAPLVGMEVERPRSDGEHAVRLNREVRPDVVVMDIAMPKLNGIEATRQILLESPATKVVALSMHADGQYVLEMLRAGASGYLLKDCAQEDLAQAIRVVHANLTFLSPGLANTVATDLVRGLAPASAGGTALTAREVEVLKRLAKGQSAKAMAADLQLSPKTVETHRQHIMKKLRIQSVAGLTRYAIRRGLIEMED